MTPAYSPESKGMAKALVSEIKRDHKEGADISDGATVIRQLPTRNADYNGLAAFRLMACLHPWSFAPSAP